MQSTRVGQFMEEPPPDRPLTRSERWALAVFLLIILGLFTAELAVDYHPVKLSVLFIVLFWAPLLALHEAGHAVMAAALGWRVLRVVVGFGRTVSLFHVKGTPVEVKLVPLEGFVRPAPTNLRYPRLKNALIYLAGPLSEAILLILIVLVVGPDVLLRRTEYVPVIAAQSLSVAILMGLIFNLIPHSVTTREGSTANDGLGMFLSFFLPLSHFAERMTEPAPDGADPQAGEDRD